TGVARGAPRHSGSASAGKPRMTAKTASALLHGATPEAELPLSLFTAAIRQESGLRQDLSAFESVAPSSNSLPSPENRPIGTKSAGSSRTSYRAVRPRTGRQQLRLEAKSRTADHRYRSPCVGCLEQCPIGPA